MSFGTITGKSQLIGWGNPQPFPITLDVAVYEGAVVYADNNKIYYSDGTSWLEIGTGPQGVQGYRDHRELRVYKVYKVPLVILVVFHTIMIIVTTQQILTQAPVT